MNLWSEFPIHSLDEWKNKLKKDLKNNDPSSLTWEHSIGEIDPLINHNTNNNFSLNNSRIKSLSWNINKSNYTNSFVLKSLSFGINSLIFENIPYDKDVLNNVMHEIIFQHVLINHDSSKEISNSWINWIKNNFNECKGSFRFDPIQLILENKNQNDELKQQMNFWKSLMTDLFETNYSCVYIDGSIYGNALANCEDEVAYIISHANEYLEQIKNNNIKCPDKLIVKIALSPQYLIEIGKVRALRFLLENVIKQHNLSIDIEIETIYNSSFYNPIDEESNIMRKTTAYMASMITGCESIEITDYQMKDRENYYSKNISTNIALILKEESHLDKVSDPSKGSYYIESITKKIIDKSWKTFLSIENEGGWIEYLKNSKAQNKCAENKLKTIEALAKNQKNIIGYNKFSDFELNFNKAVDTSGFKPFNLKMFV